MITPTLAAPLHFAGPVELLLILLIVLVLFFGSDATNIASEAGRAVGEFQTSKAEVERELSDEFEEVQQEIDEVREDVSGDIEEVQDEVNQIESALTVDPTGGLDDSNDSDVEQEEDAVKEK